MMKMPTIVTSTIKLCTCHAMLRIKGKTGSQELKLGRKEK